MVRNVDSRLRFQEAAAHMQVAKMHMETALEQMAAGNSATRPLLQAIYEQGAANSILLMAIANHLEVQTVG